MKLAWHELVRRPSRFVTAGAILTLIALLLMFLGGLLDGLIQTSTSGIEIQEADALVFSASADGALLRSRIDPATREAVAALDGVDEVGGIGVTLLGTRVPGAGPREIASAAVWGYELAPRGVPEPPADGEAWADRVLSGDGVEIGDVLLAGPARTPITVIGWVDGTSYNGQPGLWANLATWRAVLAANRPGATLGDGVVQALVVRGSSDLPATVRGALGDTVSAFTTTEAIEAIPGVTAQRSTFNQVMGITVVIALVVISLFFALLTVERTALYGVLKAIGARSRTIFAGLVLQAVAITLSAAAIAALAVVAIDVLIPPGSVPLSVSAGRIALSTALLLVAAVAGCTFSLRRVLRVDPASALGGA